MSIIYSKIVSYLHFSMNKNLKTNSTCLKLKINVFALEKMPRISRAQSMDVLSSQSNLSGYKAVIDAASEFNKAFPLMMTSAGTVAPLRFSNRSGSCWITGNCNC